MFKSFLETSSQNTMRIPIHLDDGIENLKLTTFKRIKDEGN